MGSIRLIINGTECLEIEPGAYVYEKMTGTCFLWGQIDLKTLDALESILGVIPDVTGADDYGYRTSLNNDMGKWHPWSLAPPGLRENIGQVERGILALIKAA